MSTTPTPYEEFTEYTVVTTKSLLHDLVSAGYDESQVTAGIDALADAGFALPYGEDLNAQPVTFDEVLDVYSHLDRKPHLL